MTFATHAIETQRRQLVRWTVAALVVLAVHAGGGALGLLHWQQEETSEDTAGAIIVELAPQPAATPVDTPDVAHGPVMEEVQETPQVSKQAVEEVPKDLPLIEPSPAPDPEVVVPVQRPVERKEPETEKTQEAETGKQNPEQASAKQMTMAPPRVDVPAAPSSAAPTQGRSPTAARAQASWERALINHLDRHKQYPSAARSRGAQGIVVVGFRIGGDGNVLASHVAKSSGSAALDEEALAVLKRASPLPVPPEALVMADLTLPIRFHIK
jgi:TonB family protein